MDVATHDSVDARFAVTVIPPRKVRSTVKQSVDTLTVVEGMWYEQTIPLMIMSGNKISINSTLSLPKWMKFN